MSVPSRNVCMYTHMWRWEMCGEPLLACGAGSCTRGLDVHLRMAPWGGTTELERGLALAFGDGCCRGRKKAQDRNSGWLLHAGLALACGARTRMCIRHCVCRA
eukprot:366371-Chlamydomonas_euryale.AAC.3